MFFCVLDSDPHEYSRLKKYANKPGYLNGYF